MLHVYYGQDRFRIIDAYNTLRRSLDADGMLVDNTTQLEARGLQPAKLIEHCATVPFLATARVTVVEGLVRSLVGRRRVLDTWQPLLDFLPAMPPTNHLFLLEPGNREQMQTVQRSPLLRALRDLPDTDDQSFPELRTYGSRGAQSEVAVWLRDRAQEQAVQIEPQAIAELVSLVGSNLAMLSTELEKLATYAGQRAITAEDMRLLTPEAQEASIFGIVDAAVEGRAGAALALLHKAFAEGSHSPPRVQGMIARQLRNMIRAAELLEANAPPAAIGEATGVRSDYPLRKLIAQARATPRPIAEQGLRAVEESDHAVKTGRLEAELSIELLITQLASLAAQPRTRAMVR